jgi:hypothetical protein
VAASHEIEAFLDRAMNFGGEELLLRLGGIVRSLGERAAPHDKVREFVEASLRRPSVTHCEEFIVERAASRAANTLRLGPPFPPAACW